VRALAVLALIAAAIAVSWPHGQLETTTKAAAIRRGLHFIYATATDARNFKEYGFDYLWCFHCIASTSADPELRWLALRMGQERAQQWRRDHPHVPEGASADEVVNLGSGSYAADCLGFPNHELKEEVRRAAARFKAEDFLRFDPAKEPVPDDIPQFCEKCDTQNSRGARVCRKCGRPRKMMNRFDVLEDAVVAAYTGDRFGVSLGRSYADVVRWAPSLRPYRGYDGGRNQEYDSVFYLITHIIYTLNDYSTYRLRPEWLPHEYEFLKSNLRHSIALDDPEAVGEFMDTLKSFGRTEADPLLRDGVEFLLSRQNPDGSWGDMRVRDIYNRYHPTWTAIDGLRDYAWRGEGVSYPEALRNLRNRSN
jgi:hypothetical protein